MATRPPLDVKAYIDILTKHSELADPESFRGAVFKVCGKCSQAWLKAAIQEPTPHDFNEAGELQNSTVWHELWRGPVQPSRALALRDAREWCNQHADEGIRNAVTMVVL